MNERKYKLPSMEGITEILKGCVDPETSSEAHKIGKLLILSCWFGESEADLARESGMDIQDVFGICVKLVQNGVFGLGLNLYEDYFEKEDSGIALNLDILCGEGKLKRVSKDSTPMWVITDEGLSYAESKLHERLAQLEKR